MGQIKNIKLHIVTDIKYKVQLWILESPLRCEWFDIAETCGTQFERIDPRRPNRAKVSSAGCQCENWVLTDRCAKLCGNTWMQQEKRGNSVMSQSNVTVEMCTHINVFYRV